MSEYLDFAIGLARQAGAIMRKNFSLGMKKEWKGDETPVTVTDETVNRLVIDAIEERYPEHSILSEEGNGTREAGEYVWVCDPVDGTVPFSHGIPTCVFSLALCRDGAPIAGVIYDPFLDRIFTAERGSGAFCNGRKIQVNDATDLKRKVVAVEYYGGTAYPVAVVPKLLEAGALPLTNLCIIYPSVLVASGDVTAGMFQMSKPYDGAALKIIIDEAGGKMTDVDGNEQRYDRPINGYIASNGKVHEQLLKIVRSAKSS